MNRFVGALFAHIVLLVSAGDAFAVGYVFTNIADSTTDAPVGKFTGFSTPSIDGGIVAFRGDYPFGTQGVFIGNGGPVGVIVENRAAGPNGPLDVFSAPTISKGVVAFSSDQADRLQTSGIFFGSGGAISTVSLERDPAPADAFRSFGDPAISDNTIAFVGTFGKGSKFTEAIFVSNGGPLKTIALEGDSSLSGVFSAFHELSLFRDSVAFNAFISSNESGIFVGSGGPITTIAKSGDPSPIGELMAFNWPSIHGDGVAFVGASGSEGGPYESGIFIGDGDSLITVVKSGDPAPAATFMQFQGVSYDGDSVAFQGNYEDLSHRGIFSNAGGDIATVVKIGDSLFGSEIIDLSFDRFGLDPAGGGGIAFGYWLADGRRGVALASQVPEPCTTALIAAALEFLLPRSRFRGAQPSAS